MGKGDKAKRRAREEKHGGLTLLIVGACLLLPAILHRGWGGLEGGTAIGGLICAGLGGIGLYRSFLKSRELPKKEIMRLAEQRGGLVTVSEIATALDIEPELAIRTLKELSKTGIASQRWEEIRKNLWEFPDYMTLPISESLELAKHKGGRLTVNDLVASGHSLETARQTLDALSEKGLAQQDPAAGTTDSMIVTTQ